MLISSSIRNVKCDLCSTSHILPHSHIIITQQSLLKSSYSSQLLALDIKDLFRFVGANMTSSQPEATTYISGFFLVHYLFGQFQLDLWCDTSSNHPPLTVWVRLVQHLLYKLLLKFLLIPTHQYKRLCQALSRIETLRHCS